MVSQRYSLHLRCLWVLSFWVWVVFISSRRLGLSFPQVAPVPGYSIFSVFLYLLDLAISLTISWRGSRSSPSPGSSFSCQFLVPSRGAFPCAGCLPLAVSPVTHSSLAVPPALGELGPSFSSSSHAFSSFFGALALLFMAPRPFCLRSFFPVLTFVQWLLLVGLLWVSFYVHRVLIPSVFCSLCVHGSRAFISPATFFPCRVVSGGPLSFDSLLQVVVLLSGGHAPPFLFIVTPSGVPCRSSVWFLIFLSSLLALMASSSSVPSLPSSAGFSHPLVARRLGVPPSRHPWFPLLVGSWSSSMALLFHGLLPPPLHLAISSSSISLGLHPLLRCCGSLSCPLLGLSCRSPCLHALLLLGVFLLFAWAPGGFVQCSLVSLGRVASTFLFPVYHPCSYGLHPTISMSVFPGYCLFPSSALLFLSLVWALRRLAWFFPALRLLTWFPFLSLSFRSSLHVLLWVLF